ncbi:MAG: hypothetical protein EON58_19320 [Alphaproteobacteria bacterium]|nr:MAG: hypothetical protein EON58_19320 [Alphaproteobacteria bacterium]
MASAVHARQLIRHDILAYLAEGTPIPMVELARHIYGESKPAHIARMRMQISILRSSGYAICYDRSTKSYHLLPGHRDEAI